MLRCSHCGDIAVGSDGKVVMGDKQDKRPEEWARSLTPASQLGDEDAKNAAFDARTNGWSETQRRSNELFRQFLQGDDTAFQALYDLFERPLYVFLLRLLIAESDAQDIFQDVWVRIYQLRADGAQVDRFSGLLFTIARNLSLNVLRARKRHPGVSVEDVALVATPELIFTNEEDMELREMLQKAMAQLGDEQREAFVLREYNGHSYEEIAAITGTTMTTAKTRAWRARERLRKVIAAWLDLKG